MGIVTSVKVIYTVPNIGVSLRREVYRVEMLNQERIFFFHVKRSLDPYRLKVRSHKVSHATDDIKLDRRDLPSTLFS